MAIYVFFAIILVCIAVTRFTVEDCVKKASYTVMFLGASLIGCAIKIIASFNSWRLLTVWSLVAVAVCVLIVNQLITIKENTPQTEEDEEDDEDDNVEEEEDEVKVEKIPYEQIIIMDAEDEEALADTDKRTIAGLKKHTKNS